MDGPILLGSDDSRRRHRRYHSRSRSRSSARSDTSLSLTDSEDESKVEKLRKNRLERVKEIKESKRKRKAVDDIEDGEVDSEGNKTENTLCDLQPELVFLETTMIIWRIFLLKIAPLISDSIFQRQFFDTPNFKNYSAVCIRITKAPFM